jgi:hypothetical protein
MTQFSEVQPDVISDSGFQLDMPYVTGGQDCQDLLHPNSWGNAKTSPESPKNIVSVEQEDPWSIPVHT